MLRVFIDNQEITYGEYIPLDEAQSEPRTKIIGKNNNLFTIVMVDPDAPAPNNPIYKYFLHWLIINNSDTVEEFTPPNPPIGTHRYVFLLLRQQSYIDPKKIQIVSRQKFPLAKFINDFKLKIMDSTFFQTSKS